MAQSGYTPILIYGSGTATNVPLAANLTSSANGAELALNYADGKLYYKNSSGVVTLLASAAAASGTSPGGSTTQVQYNNAGAFAGSANLTFDGTNLTSGGTVTATKLIPTGNVTAGNGMYLPTTNTLAFSTNGSERMRIDSSGNVGIGLTPVANNGILQLNSYGAIKALIEGATVSATAATGTINYDAATQAVLYYTSNASANWTVNFRGSASLSLNSMMQTGQSLTVAFLVTQGATAYYNSAVQVDGASVTPKWQGGTAPSSGNASSIDIYIYTIVKTGSAAFTVFASQTKFA